MRVKWNAKDVEKPHCATCDLMDLYPERCGWINPVFADDGRSVVINCRGKSTLLKTNFSYRLQCPRLLAAI